MPSQAEQTPPGRVAAPGEFAFPRTVVLVSAEMEWRLVRENFPAAELQASPYGAWFRAAVGAPPASRALIFLHGGWGKIAAAASTEYAIQRWQPALLVNLGTCGGFAGVTQQGEILLVERTVVYDIVEQMGDGDAHIAHYTTELNLSWLGATLPSQARRGVLVSADRDLFYEDIPELIENYGALAADWESGAIAWVAARHHTPCLILRGVSDVVGPSGSAAYGDMDYFERGTRQVMSQLLTVLPRWMAEFWRC